MKEYEFDSQWTEGAMMRSFTEDEVKNEPMFFNATPEYVYYHGGPISRAFLTALANAETWPSVIDTRVHMLMPGWHPAIPGWHHDDVPRSVNEGGHVKMSEHGQPNYDAPAYHSRHALALINGDIAPTQFATGKHRLPWIDPEKGATYKFWNDIVDKQIADGTLTLSDVPSNCIVYFDWQTMHRAVPAVKSGWRWFGRASFQTGRQPTNEIRKQVQVYLPLLTQGW